MTTSLALVRRIAARPSIVFEALATAEGIASWWGPEALPVLSTEFDARMGGAYRVRFQTGDGQQHEAFGQVLTIDPPHRLTMSWAYAHGGEPDEAGRTSRLEFVLRAIEGGTELTFTQTDLKTEVSRRNHELGWAGAFAKLVARLEHFPKSGNRFSVEKCSRFN